MGKAATDWLCFTSSLVAGVNSRGIRRTLRELTQTSDRGNSSEQAASPLAASV